MQKPKPSKPAAQTTAKKQSTADLAPQTSAEPLVMLRRTGDPQTVADQPAGALPRALWNPWLGVVFVLVVFFVSQIFASVPILVYTSAKQWTATQANNWLNASVIAQFIYILLAESFVVGAIYGFLRLYKRTLAVIGFKRPRGMDFVYGLAAVIPYYLLYVVAVGVVGHFYGGLNVNQKQQIGFTSVHGFGPLFLTFLSLVVLPPLAEEIMVRGFLFSSLKSAMRLWPAIFLTSLIFASAHLPEGGSSGPLWIGFIDTFSLSLVLCYLREKTNSLWAGITLHALKNGIAFVALFIFTNR